MRRLIGPFERFEHSKAYDLAAASPLIVLYGWVLARDGPALGGHFGRAVERGLGIAELTDAVGRSLSLAFAALIIVLLLVRTLPIRKSPGILPRAVALIGTFGGVSMLALPAASLPLWLGMVSVGLIFFAMGALLVSLAWLRRSFSVLPEARRLVTSGPYALIRHPVYLFEGMAFFGVMLQSAQPWAMLIFAVQLCFQLARIPYEERVLTDAFPEYADYAARTSRLIPGVY